MVMDVGDDATSSRFKEYTHTATGRCGVRVSGGHLCEAEAPTEPTDETQRPLRLWCILTIKLPYNAYAGTISTHNKSL